MTQGLGFRVSVPGWHRTVAPGGFCLCKGSEVGAFGFTKLEKFLFRDVGVLARA